MIIFAEKNKRTRGNIATLNNKKEEILTPWTGNIVKFLRKERVSVRILRKKVRKTLNVLIAERTGITRGTVI
jgi:hypothetical protein